MFLNFPDNQQYINKKYMFIVSVKIKNTKTTGTRYARVYVEIGDKKQDKIYD